MKIVIKKFVRFCIYIYCKVVYRAKAEGLENIPKDEPVILCGNHRSFLDAPLVLATTKNDNIRFVAKEEIKKMFIVKLLGSLYNAIYVKRDEKDITALKDTLKALKNNETVLIFPEGTRKGTSKGEEVKDGAAFFTMKSGVKVLPFGISGGEKLFKQVKIKYGKPIDFSEHKDYKNKEEVKKVTNEIMKHIFELT